MIYISDTVAYSASAVLQNKRKDLEAEKLIAGQDERSSDILQAIRKRVY